MGKIAIIGAGGHMFASRLIPDILSYPELRDSTISLMDIDEERLGPIAAFARRLVKQHGFETKIESTTDRRKALAGADYVVLTIQVDGWKPWHNYVEVIAKHFKIRPATCDTVGAGGVFYALRHVPAILDICRDMEELCPDAWLLNYTNPMAMICSAVNNYTHIKNIGLCHSVQHTSEQLAGYLGVPSQEISHWVAGINHMAWFLELKWRGKDAYPLLREKFNKNPEIYDKADETRVPRRPADIVRVEVFKAFGYFVTESSRHMSGFVPYFRKRNRPELLEKYGIVETWFEASYEGRSKWLGEMDKVVEQEINSTEKIPIRRSVEYGSTIIHSLVSGIPSRINGNVKNNGLITNLSAGCCVEVPCLIDKGGIHPCYVGDLPPQCAALNQPNVNVQELAVKGVVEKDKTKIFQAILLDPLTGAVLTIDETRQLVEELFQAEAGYLKGFK